MQFAIGKVYLGTWGVFFGEAEKVKDFLISNFNGAFINIYANEEKMQKQLEYLKTQLINPAMHSIEDIHVAQ
jgi:hypothetical protein